MRILIDGYNLIYACEECRGVAGNELEAARDALIRELMEYGARRECEIEVVFDGRGDETRSERPVEFLTVTFTASGRSADSYIEAAVYSAGSDEPDGILVVTGDYDQQKVVLGSGSRRMSSREFLEDVRESREEAGRAERPFRVELGKRLPPEVRSRLGRMRGDRSRSDDS